MNSQYNIVIQWSGDKVFFWNFPAAGLYMSNPFLKFPVVPLVAGFIHCQRFQFK